MSTTHTQESFQNSPHAHASPAHATRRGDSLGIQSVRDLSRRESLGLHGYDARSDPRSELIGLSFHRGDTDRTTSLETCEAKMFATFPMTRPG